MTAPFQKDDRSIDELLAEAEVLGRPGTLGSDLDSVTASSGDELVDVTVNVHGKLTGLRLARQATSLPSAELALRIRTHVTAAAADALRQGMEHLERVVNPLVMAALAEALGDAPPAVGREPAAQDSAVDEDDHDEPFELKPLD